MQKSFPNLLRLSSPIFSLLVIFSVAACTNSALPRSDNSAQEKLASKLLKEGMRTAKISQPIVRPVSNNPQPHLPVNYSYNGITSEVKDISRIITIDMYGTLSQIVFNLGLGKNMVGRDTSTDFPEALHLPKIMDQPHTINLETILNLRPTIVLTDGSIGSDTTYNRIRALNIPVVEFDSNRSLSNNSALIKAVATTLGVSELGDKLAQRTDKEIIASKRYLPTEAKKLDFMFLYLRGRGTMLIFGDKLGAGSLINALGATNSAEALNFREEYRSISSETLLSANPNLLLVMTQGANSIGGMPEILKLPGMQLTDAGKHKRIVEMDQNSLLSFGPNVGLVLSALAKEIYR